MFFNSDVRPIKKGEEIFTNYNYPHDILSSKRGLDWYTDLQEEDKEPKDEL